MGIVFKFALIKVRFALRLLLPFESKIGFIKALKLGLPLVPNALFAGMAENLRERRFYKKTKHPFLLKTYFSLFGLVNIQKFGLPYTGSASRIWKFFYQYAGEDLYGDPHCFENPMNFCIDSDSRLKVLDYGSKGSQEVITKYGNEMMLFDTNEDTPG